MTLTNTRYLPDADAVWMHVRSIELDRASGTVGARLTDGTNRRTVFVPLDGGGTPRAYPVEHGSSLLLDVIAGVGAKLRHVDLSVEPGPDAHGHPRVRTAELVLTDASAVRCDVGKALALSAHAGVPVRLGDDAVGRAPVATVPAQVRAGAPRLPV